MPDAHQEMLSASTRYCAVLGHPIRHSASPAMQNAGIAVLGLDWRYLAFETAPENLRAAIEGARAMGFIGLNLTVPHKLPAVELMDTLDESAERWQAVNTVRFEGRSGGDAWIPFGQTTGRDFDEIRCQGFNTDADAIVRSIEEDLKLDLRSRQVVLLGAGGAGSVAAQKLAEAGAGKLWLVNRTRSKAEELAAVIRDRHPESAVGIGYPEGEVDLTLNATSLGLKPEDPLPFDGGAFDLARSQCAYDMIYRPQETPFLARAREAGCRTANGMGMLLHQGAAALEIWSGRPAPVDAMRSALIRHLQAT